MYKLFNGYLAYCNLTIVLFNLFFYRSKQPNECSVEDESVLYFCNWSKLNSSIMLHFMLKYAVILILVVSVLFVGIVYLI